MTRRLLALLAIEPLVVLAVLANGATHDLIRFSPEAAAHEELPVVGTGPVFWVHLVYANVMILSATGLFVAAANLLHDLEVGRFARLDLTPFARSVDPDSGPRDHRSADSTSTKTTSSGSRTTSPCPSTTTRPNATSA